MSRKIYRAPFRFGLGAALATALVVTLPTIPASAERATAGKSIDQFVERVHDKFGLKIDATDYEMRSHGEETLIVRKDASMTATQKLAATAPESDGQERLGRSFTQGKSSPPTPAEARKQAVEGDMRVQQGIGWYEPECWSNNNPPLTDPDDAGWMDACWQWGDMNYVGATRANFAFRMYATCKPGEANFYELVECYVDTVEHPDSAPLVWNDWSPKSTTDLGGCGQVQLQVGVGPVVGGATVSTCEELIPERETAPADMRTRWVGDAYWKEDVRETGQIVSVGVAWGQVVAIQPSFGYFYSSCSFGDVLDLCG